MNLGIFTGHLGRDAEVRVTAAGKNVLSFSLAVKTGWGEREKTMWVKCITFGRQAEGQLVDYLKKGTQVGVSGEISLNEWTTKEGEKRADIEVVCNNIELLGSKSGGQQGAPAQQEPQQSSGGGAFDEDIPFAPHPNW